VRYGSSVLGAVVKALPRRTFAQIVERHDADRYDKEFDSWDHLMALLYAQLGGIGGLRELAASWNAHGQHHYHLGCGKLYRSTLSDANARRPPAVFAELFAAMSARLREGTRREGSRLLVRLLDASPIPLPALCAWARSNGRTRGMKLHLVYDPRAVHPLDVAITAATVNDVTVGREAALSAGAIYVFDKAYADYAWWGSIADAGAFFVTRAKTNVRFETLELRPVPSDTNLVEDALVRIVSKNAKPPGPLRRITVHRDDGSLIVLLSNDLTRDAADIAALYRERWQIELLFRWIKQHLNIKRFLGRSENAVRLQILAAMIAFLLLRVAADRRPDLPLHRLADLVRRCTFQRRPIDHIDRPPPPWTPPKPHPNQIPFAYA
jgi:putative transposase